MLDWNRMNDLCEEEVANILRMKGQDAQFNRGKDNFTIKDLDIDGYFKDGTPKYFMIFNDATGIITGKFDHKKIKV